MIDPATFLSGDAGDVTTPARRLKRAVGEAAYGAIGAALATGPRADRLAARRPRLRVLAVGIYRPGSRMREAVAALHSSRHDVTVALGATAAAEPGIETVAEGLDGGKFENLNRVLAVAPDPGGYDWTLVLDDDLRLPRRFLDRFLGVCEAAGLDLAQPAQTLRSHSAWKVTRRRPATLVRETRFVEIGPLTAFRREPATELMPFPGLRFGWGLDLHWAALAFERGWRLGVVDAVPVRHEAALVASSYSRDDAIDEAARFLAGRPYLPSAEANQTLAVRRRL